MLVTVMVSTAASHKIHVEAACLNVPASRARACGQELRPSEVLRVDPIRLMNFFFKFKFIYLSE